MSERHAMQTGGSKKTWSFDPADVENLGPIRDALVHEDVYFFEEQGMTTLAIVMDKILDDLPLELADAVRLVHLKNMSLRGAARILKVDHKTVKARVEKGVVLMRQRLTDSVWIAEMLRGYIPRDELISKPIEKNNVSDIIKTLGDSKEES